MKPIDLLLGGLLLVLAFCAIQPVQAQPQPEPPPPDVVNLAASVNDVDLMLVVVEDNAPRYGVIGPDSPAFVAALEARAPAGELAAVLQGLAASRGKEYYIRTLGRPDRKLTVVWFE